MTSRERRSQDSGSAIGGPSRGGRRSRGPSRDVPFTFVLGAVVVVAEPAVRILAHQIEDLSAGSLRTRFVVAAIALGVAVALTLGMWRVLADFHLAYILLPGYALALLLTLFTPRSFVPVSYDAGAVATGPVAVNFVLPLFTGVAVALWGDTASVGFGIVALIALFPIITMLLLGVALGRRKRET